MHGTLTRIRSAVALDRQAGYLAALFLLVQLPAIWLARALQPVADEIDTPVGGPDATAAESAGAGAAWAGAEVALAVGMLVGLALYRRLPEELQNALKVTMLGLGFMYLGGNWATRGVLVPGMALFVTLTVVVSITHHFDIWWLINNTLALGIAVVLGALLPLVVGVWGLLVGLIALTVYDHIFADRNDWMFDIADIFLRARIPIIVYKPPSWRFDWDRLYDEVDDETETPTHSWGIGTADLALVAAFAAAVATLPPDSLLAAGPLAVVGVVAGSVVGCLRLRYELLTDGSGAGLPALTTGMVAGLAVVQVPLLALAAV